MDEHADANKQSVLSRYLPALLLSIATVALTHFVYGLFWEDYEKGMASFIYGDLYSPPYELWFMEGLLFLFPSLAFVSQVFDHVPVYGIWHIGILILIISLWYHLSIGMLSRKMKTRRAYPVLLSILFVTIVIGISFVYVNVTRSSFLLSSVSLLLYLDRYITQQRRSRAYLLLFFLGALLRIQASVITLTAITLITLLTLRNIRQVATLLKFQWIFVILCLLIVRGSKSSTNAGQTMENTYEYAIMDRKDVVPLAEMKTHRDSIRYIALTSYFIISDSAQITVPFIKRVVDMNRYFYVGINAEDLSHLSDILSPLVRDHKPVLIAFYLILMIAAWGCKWRTLCHIMLLHIVGWAIVCAIAMKINMIDSFLGPWISILISSSFCMLFWDGHRIRRWQAAIIVLGLLVTFPALTGYLSRISQREREYNLKADTYLKRLEQIATSSTPVIWDYSQEYLPTEVLSRGKSAVLQKCVQQSPYAEAMYYHFGQERNIKMFGCSPTDWPGTHAGFLKKHEKLKFIATPEVAEFLRIYYKEIYNLDYLLVKDLPGDEILPNTYVYHLSVDSIQIPD